MKKLVLIDSNALVHRAFHALPPSMTSPKGAMTNAVYGFTTVFLKMLKDLKPDYIAATFDLAGGTFRHEEFAEYKAHRVKAPDELYAQIPPIKEMLTAFGVPIFEKQGYEADDLIGSLAQKAKKVKNLQTIIVTGDLDTLQLVEGEKVVIFTLRKGMTDTVIYDEKEVHNRYGLKPSQVIDFKGLKGDPSDNIPGVKGVGEKTASTLIQEYGSLENLYKKLSTIHYPLSTSSKKEKTFEKGILTESLVKKLLGDKDMAFFSKKLATIVCNLDIDFDLKKAEWREHVDQTVLEKLFKDLGFMSLLRRISEALNGETGSPKNKAAELPAQQALLPSIPGPIQDKDRLIGHDVKPVIKELLQKKKPVPQEIFDTKIAAWLLQPDARGYEFEKIWNIEFDQSFTGIPEDMMRLKDALWEKIKSANLIKVFEDIEMPLLPVIARMELYGISVDLAGVKKLLTKTTKEIERLEKEIYKLAGTEFNINSPAQMSEILFERLGIAVVGGKGKIKRTGGGALSTAAGELDKIIDAHPIVPKLLEYREISKLLSTYIEPFPHLVGTDGKLHTTYNQAGAGTGRLSSINPNLQNIPVRTELGMEFRKAFIPAEGFSLVKFDYSQIELRLVAHIAQDAKMMAAFKAGEDIHTRTAAEIFKVAAGEVTKDMRRQAKVLNFGIIYGMGVRAFGRTAGVDQTKAREFIEAYFKEFAGVAKYMEDTKKFVRKHGYVETLFGRRRPLPDINSSMPMLRAQAERMAINHPAQGTGADLVKMAMNAVDTHIQKEKWSDDVHMLLQVHDELVFEIRKGKEKAASNEIKKLMESVHKFDVPIVVDVLIGDNWAEMERLEK